MRLPDDQPCRECKELVPYHKLSILDLCPFCDELAALRADRDLLKVRLAQAVVALRNICNQAACRTDFGSEIWEAIQSGRGILAKHKPEPCGTEGD